MRLDVFGLRGGAPATLTMKKIEVPGAMCYMWTP